MKDAYYAKTYVAASACLPGAKGFSLCQISEPSTNLLALGMLILCVALVAYLVYCLRRSYRDSPTVTRIATSSQKTIEPPPAIIFFSTTATTRKRCFHVTETCPGLNKVSSVCSANACKICVKHIIQSDRLSQSANSIE